MTKPPAQNQENRKRIIRAIYEHGALSIEELRLNVDKMDRKFSQIRRSVEHMVRDGQLCRHGDIHSQNEKYSLPESMYAWIIDIVDAEERIKAAQPLLVQKRTPTPFHPIRTKYIPSAAGTRGDAARDICFKSAVSQCPVPFQREWLA